MRPAYFCVVVLLLFGSGFAAPRAHTVVLGKWRAVQVRSDSGEGQEVKVRELIIDERIREYTTGPAHEITDRLFVVRRAYRINDALPEETRKPQQWVWRLGGWISVDRQTGHVAQLNLPAFDGDTSEASWYRDYAAYCGISSSGEQIMAVVAEIGSNKPLYRKELGKNTMGDLPDSNCLTPRWERQPARVTFLPKAGEKFTVNVSGHFADVAADNDDDE